MVIREAGILFRGFTLVNGLYHQTSGDKVDNDLRSGLLTAILNFAENAFSKDLVEYFEGKKFCIAFKEDEIMAQDSAEPELLVAYAILDNEKKFEKYIHKVLQPLLLKVLAKFKADNEKKNLSEISQFSYFTEFLDSIFGSDTKTVDQKLEGLFFTKK